MKKDEEFNIRCLESKDKYAYWSFLQIEGTDQWIKAKISFHEDSAHLAAERKEEGQVDSP